jgi:hypothetical protein
LVDAAKTPTNVRKPTGPQESKRLIVKLSRPNVFRPKDAEPSLAYRSRRIFFTRLNGRRADEAVFLEVLVVVVPGDELGHLLETVERGPVEKMVFPGSGVSIVKTLIPPSPTEAQQVRVFVPWTTFPT